jgi:nitrite reductase (NADH) large subunit
MSSMRKRLVVVGNGMAAGRMLEHLTVLAPDAYDVTLFGAEPRGNYNRILLSPLLAGRESFEQIVIHDSEWYAARNVSRRFGETVTRIDRSAKTVRSRNGDTPYDKLVIATGSAPFLIPVAGRDLQGVLTFRDLDDVNAMIAAAQKPGLKVVVIGGGLLGLEAAAALRERGAEVTVLHLMGHLMELQLDAAAGRLLQRELEGRGIKVHCRAQTTAILGHRRVEAVLLDDGTVYPADLVVMATGIRPETRIATESRLQVERGIVVDETMRTSDPDILAIGECVQHNDICYGFVAPLYDMAEVAARSLAGQSAAFRPVQNATSLKVTGIGLYSVGEFNGGEGTESILLSDPGIGLYRKLVLRDGRLAGAVLFGDTNDGPWYLHLIRSGAPVERMRDGLAFGRAAAERLAA